MKDVSVKDLVFNDKGNKVKVLATTEVMENRPCYEITFSDGSFIIADKNHQWKVEDKKYRKNIARNKNTGSKISVKTTEELLKDYNHFRKDGSIENNYSIKNTEPIKFNKANLILEPYLLGLWLGDGSSNAPRITIYDDEVLGYIKELGYIIGKSNKKCYTIHEKEKYPRGKNYKTIIYKLRELGVVKNKHIPDIYKFSNINQRLELLKGLMDSDGHCEKEGNLEFCNTNETLARDVFYLISSLGIKSSFYEYDCKLYGRYIGKKYRIGFSTNLPVFKIKRKLDRIKEIHNSAINRRFIKEIRKIDSVPVKCIQVESGIYLAGNNLIPTHNSAICGYIIVEFFLSRISEIRQGKANSCKIWVVAGSYELTSKVFEYVVNFLLAYDKSFSKYISGGQGGRPYQLKMSASVWIQCKSSSEPMSLLGERVDLEVCDEAPLIPEKIYHQNIKPSVSSLGGKIYFIGTPRGKGWFKDKYYILKEKNATFNYPSIAGKHYTKETLEELQKGTPEMLYRQEYLAEFIDDAGIVFRNVESIIEDCEQDAIPGHHYIMGVDLAETTDWTVISVFDTETKKQVHFDRFQHRDYPLQKKQIIAKAERYNNARIIMDTTGVGKPIYEDLMQEGAFVEDFTFTGRSKEELIGKCIVAIEEKYIRLLPNEVQKDEFNTFEYKFINEKTGLPLKNIQYGAPQGYHDDCVCSVALAVWGLQPGRPKEVNNVLEAFKRRKPKPIISDI